MYKSNVKKNRLPASKNIWDEAISDAEQRIREAQLVVINLKRGVRAFKQLRDSGEPFPGEGSETFEASDGLLGQEGDLRQSRGAGFA